MLALLDDVSVPIDLTLGIQNVLALHNSKSIELMRSTVLGGHGSGALLLLLRGK